jgi:hypothetical protein
MLRREGERIPYWKFQILTLDIRQRSGTRDPNVSERTVASLELIIARCRDGFAVHVCTISRFKVDDKRPIYDVSRDTDNEERMTRFMTLFELPNSSFCSTSRSKEYRSELTLRQWRMKQRTLDYGVLL